jgi:hypothetical protein
MNKPGDRKHISTVAHQEEIAMSQELKEKTSQQQELAIDTFKNHFYCFALIEKAISWRTL